MEKNSSDLTDMATFQERFIFILSQLIHFSQSSFMFAFFLGVHVCECVSVFSTLHPQYADGEDVQLMRYSCIVLLGKENRKLLFFY